MKLAMIYSRELLSKHKALFAKSMGFMMIVIVTNILLPCGMRLFSDKLAETDSWRTVAVGLIFFIICMTVNLLAETAWYVSLDELGGKCMEELTASMQAALAFASGNDIDEIGADVLKHTMYADVLDVFRVVGHHVPSLAGAAITIIICIALAFTCNVRLAIFVVISSLAGVALTYLSRKMIALRAGKTNLKMKRHHAVCDQYIESLPLVQTNAVLDYFQDRSRESLEDFISIAKSEDKIVMIWTKLVSHYNSLISIALSMLLILQSADNTVTNLVFFTMLTGIISAQVENAESLMQQIIRAQASFINTDRVRSLSNCHGDMELRDIEEINCESVSFKYNKTKVPVIDKLSCSFKKGDTVHLYGGNGSGKSTFIRLLTGVYRPVEGKISLNSQDLLQYDKKSLNEQILYIGQDEVLLNETLEDYLRIISGRTATRTGAHIDGKPYEENEDIKNLLNEYGFFDISAEGRKIEKNGMSLSAGQRKKLMLAKLCLRMDSASVLILDEAEAGLDIKTKGKYAKLVNELSAKKDKIIIVVEHEKSEINYNRELRLKRE